MPDDVFARIRAGGIVAVVTVDRADDAVPLAEALLEGGVPAIELTLRTPAALTAMADIRRRVPAMIVGAGTVLNAEQVKQVTDAGAAFGVSPGLNPRVVAAADRAGLPFAPGVCTPTDIELAVELGKRVLKFFPAEPCGGLSYLRVAASPFVHLGVSFIPLGGVTDANLEAYLSEPLVAAVGGTWLAPPAVVKARDWGAIRETARAAHAKVQRRPERHGV